MRITSPRPASSRSRAPCGPPWRSSRASPARSPPPRARCSPMLVAVIDYQSGNLASAARGLVLAAEQRGIKANVRITADPFAVAKADRIVLPGQGAFADCAAGLKSVEGLEEAMLNRVAEGVPFLGICVGMQL